MYITEFNKSFFLFWGIIGGYAFYAGGLLGIALISSIILMLLTHEYSHIVECEKKGVEVNRVTFKWHGAELEANAEILYAQDQIDILLAGIKDTAAYFIVFALVVLVMMTFPRELSGGYVAFIHPFRDLAWNISINAAIIFFGNTIPFSYFSKNHNVTITTDGWMAWKMREQRDELWNDGRALSLETFKAS